MPYCTQCGKPALATDLYCRHCGGRQAASSAAPRRGPGLSPHAASVLCYVPWFGWIVALYVLASEKFRGALDTRFHAYQGLYIFVAWLLVDWVVDPWLRFLPGRKPPLDHLLELGLIVIWVIMLVNTGKGRRYRLPVFGELAERSL